MQQLVAALTYAQKAGVTSQSLRLRLNYNAAIGDAGISALGTALAGGILPKLELLNLTGTGMGLEGARALAKGLPALPALLDLSAYENKIDESMKKELVKAAPSGCEVFTS